MKYVKHGTLNEYYFSFLERLCPGKNETIETISEGTNDEFSSDEFSDDEFDNATYENLNGKLFQSPKDLKKRGWVIVKIRQELVLVFWLLAHESCHLSQAEIKKIVPTSRAE